MVYNTFSGWISDWIINFVDLVKAIMASSENIPTKLDVSVIVGKVWSQFSARCYINDYFDSATNNVDSCSPCF